MSTPLDALVDYLARLPGVGRKSAARIAFWLLESDREFNTALAEAVGTIRDRIRPCSICGHYTEADPCEICDSPARERELLCVVEQSRDVMSIEATGEYRGLYHVLRGVLSPLDGIGPEELGLDRLASRVRENGVTEVIVATNPTVEGDSTALYLSRLLEGTGAKVTRIASGLPVGGDMEYADRLSVARALRGRRDIDE